MNTITVAAIIAVALLVGIAAAAVWPRQPDNPDDTSTAKPWFVVSAHDITSYLPAALQGIVQSNLLDRTFQDALLPEFLFPGVATVRQWMANMGDTQIFTRTGLLTPTTTPLNGADPAPDQYGIEQYSMTMDQYGNSMDTNMLASAIALQSKFLEDIQKLGINAGQSINRIARNKLYRAYAGGRTWTAAAQGVDSDQLVVNSIEGFDFVLISGIVASVSPTTPLAITIDGVVASVVGVDAGTNTLTLAAATQWSEGDAVVSAAAPVSFRPGAKGSAFDLVAADVATFSIFRNVVARLRTQSVPTIGGAYSAHIDPTTEAQLFSDPEFQALYAGAIESPVWGNLSLGRFGGIDWVRNNEARVSNNGTIDYHEPIVVGGDSFVAGPMQGQADLLSSLPDNAKGAIRMVSVGLEDSPLQAALIIRQPQDRLQQVVSSSWSYVGDFAVPSDSVTGGSAVFKRGVVVQHA